MIFNVGVGLVTFFGFFLGFAFGIGCALAVMYSIYLGGYRAALRDLGLAVPSKRLLEEQARLRRRQPPPGTP